MKECPECGSEKIIKNAVLREQGQSYVDMSPRVVVFENPDAIIFKRGNHSALRAEVCGKCGYIQTYATDPQGLWMAYQSSLSDVE
jgi:ribosomal protein S27AE